MMKLLSALGLASLAVAVAMVVFSAGLYGPADPYFMWGLVLLALPPAAIGLLVLAPLPSVRTVGGWVALFPGAWWIVSAGSDLAGGIFALITGSGQQDPAGVLTKVAVEGLLAVLNLAIFWTAVLRDRGGRTLSPPHSATV